MARAHPADGHAGVVTGTSRKTSGPVFSDASAKRHIFDECRRARTSKEIIVGAGGSFAADIQVAISYCTRPRARSSRTSPQCTSLRDLNAHADEWLHVFDEFGRDLSVDHARAMFTRCLPHGTPTEVYRREEAERLDLLPLTGGVGHQTAYERKGENIKPQLQRERIPAAQAQRPARAQQPMEPRHMMRRCSS